MENNSEKELTVAESIDVEEVSAEETEEMEFSDYEEDQVEDDSNENNDSEKIGKIQNSEEIKKDDKEKKKPLSKEERSIFAQARRTVEKSVEEKHKKALDKAYERGRLESYLGKTNPYTNTEIKDIEDVDAYESMYKIAEAGGDPLKDYASYIADKRREDARIQKEQEEREIKAQNEIDDFSSKYPNVNLSELLNDEQFKDYAEGKNKPLVDVYESYKKFTTAFRNKGIETAKKTIANTISSPGSLSSDSENVVDYTTMSKEEFEKVVSRVKDGV